MYPDLFGINGFTMNVFVVIGVLSGCFVIFLYLKKFALKKTTYIDLAITLIVTLVAAFIFAILFENLYECIKNAVLNNPQKWTWSMTFYGGIIGGLAVFILMYKFYFLKTNDNVLNKLLVIIPGAIALGHSFGRLGCFFNGCCYGKETDKWFGVLFPGMEHKIIPTQLFEMIFLAIFAVILLVLAFRKNTKFTVPVYLISYSTFRFIIEFFRGDERGQLGVFSPSQYISLLLFIAGIITLVIFIRSGKKNENAID